jgi:hypothetical protein
MIVPAWIIPEKVLIHDAALALLRNIRYPNTTDVEPEIFEPGQYFLPEWLVELLNHVSSFVGRQGRPCQPYLDKAICMATYDRDISRFGVRVVQRNILLDGKVQDIFLLIGSCLGIFPNMLARHDMLDDTELEGHVDCWTAYEGVLRCSQVSALPCRIHRPEYTPNKLWQWSHIMPRLSRHGMPAQGSFNLCHIGMDKCPPAF